MSTLYARRGPKAVRLVGFDILLTAGNLRSEEDVRALFVFYFLTMWRPMRDIDNFRTKCVCVCVCIVSFSTRMTLSIIKL